jgi:hypothetical protein
MSLKHSCLLGLVATVAVSAAAQAQSAAGAAGAQQPPLMERSKEIALALSACPPSVAAKAAVYVLEKSGYVKVRDSENGFTAMVQHSFVTSQEPELRAQGTSPEEMKRVMADGVAKGIFQGPTRPGIIYMLSTENVVPAEKGGVEHFPPHVMFYALGLTNAALGSEGEAGGGPFVVGEGSPFGLIIVPIALHAGSHM